MRALVVKACHQHHSTERLTKFSSREKVGEQHNELEGPLKYI